jgi:hypothetical protein
LWLLAAPGAALGASDPLVLDPDKPTPTLDKPSLDAALPVRQTCRELVRLVNEQGSLWELVREGSRAREQFEEDQRRAAEEWRSARSRCDLGIVGLPRGWPREVLDHELALIGGLQQALTAIVAAYLEERPVEEVNASIAQYDASLGGWTSWLERSSDFWNGAYLGAPRDRSCLGDVRETARTVSKTLWRLTTQAPEERVDQEITDTEFMLKGLRVEHKRCASDEGAAVDRVTHGLVGELLASYEQCLKGIRTHDDHLIRAAMADEQHLTSRLVRCKQEHAHGTPTGPCIAVPLTP